MVLAAKGRDGGRDNSQKVAQDLARDAAREQLKPLLDAACSRLASVLHRAFDVAIEAQQPGKGAEPDLLHGNAPTREGACQRSLCFLRSLCLT